MKLTYIYDLRFQFDGTHYYSKNFSDRTWQKYLDVADEIHVYPMIQQVKNSKLSPISSPIIMHNISFQSTKSIYLNLKDMWTLAMQIVASSEDIIIRLPSHIGTFVGLACIKQQKTYGVEVVGNALEAYGLHGNPVYKIAAPFLHYSMKKIVTNAAVAIYVTDNYLQQCYPNQQQNYTVANATIKKQPTEAKWQQQPFTIGMIGSLDAAYKGHTTLFKALRQLDKLNRPIIVRLLGEGSLIQHPNYQNITIQHEGIIDEQYLPAWYQSLQLYVQPSYTEAIGRSIMEAMSYGVPVVASRVGGIPELLTDDVMFPARDAKEMAAKISLFMYDSALWRRISKRNQEYIQRFEQAVVEEKRRSAFQKLSSN